MLETITANCAKTVLVVVYLLFFLCLLFISFYFHIFHYSSLINLNGIFSINY
jgi:hypothetical protein